MSYFFFNDTAPTDIYTLSLHDALPISTRRSRTRRACCASTSFQSISRGWAKPSFTPRWVISLKVTRCTGTRSEEHTSELQSRRDLVCRLLLEKKKKKKKKQHSSSTSSD